VSWDLLRSVQKETDIRLILPIGLNIRVGDIVRVGDGGKFSLEGSTKSILGIPRPSAAKLSEGRPADQTWMGGKGTACDFRIAGKGSSLFPDLPKANAGFDIKFQSANSWLLALSGRKLLTFNEADSHRKPIIDAYKRKVWEPDWALVTEVAYADKMTLLASKFDKTNVALSISGTVDAQAALTVQLTASTSLAVSNNALLQSITDEAGPIGCRAIRIRDTFWKRFFPKVGDLEAGAPCEPADAQAAYDAATDRVWEELATP
jgi:hypothetical protein